MSKLISKLSKKASSSKRYHEGAVECTDFECVSFQEKPYQLDQQRPPGDVPSQLFDKPEGKQVLKETGVVKPNIRSNSVHSFSAVNNLNNGSENKSSHGHSSSVENAANINYENDQLIQQLHRKRGGSARFRNTNGIKHGSSSSLSSASSFSSGGSYCNHVNNGFGHPQHAEILQSINQSLNQLSLVEDVPGTSDSVHAPPKPKRPSTDRVKTTMAFYANKPSFGGELSRRPPARQVFINIHLVLYIYIYINFKFTRNVSTSDLPIPEAGDIRARKRF